MTFQNPLGLLLLLTVPAIIAFHLFRSERRRVEVSSLYLWRQVADRHSRRVRPRLLSNVNLLLQLAAAILASLAAAQPHLPVRQAPSPPAVILLIDDSASMRAGDVPRLEVARNRAREIIGRASGGTRFMLLTAGPRPRIVQTFTTDRTLLYERLWEISGTDGAADLEQALALAGAVGDRAQTNLVLITDGAISASRRPEFPANLRTELVGGQDGGSSAANRAVTAFELRVRPDGSAVEALVGVANHASDPAEVRLRLSADGITVSEHRIGLDAGEERLLTAVIPRTRALVYAAEFVDNEDALPADDRAYAVAAGERPVRVHLATPGNHFLESLLSVYPNVELTVTDRVRQPLSSDLLILDRVAAPSGLRGSVLALGTSLPDGPFAAQQLIPVDRPASGRVDSPLTGGVRLGEVRITRILIGDLHPRATVVAASGEHPLLYTYEDDRLSLVGTTFALSDTDLTMRTGFPVLMHNIIERLAPVAPAGELGYARPGRIVTLSVAPGEELVIVTPDGTRLGYTPRTSRFEFSQTWQAGLYEVRSASSRARFAVNLLDSDESNLVPRLEAVRGEVESPAGAATAGRPVWRWLAIATLVLLAADWLVWVRRY